ncbi:MAG: hypothetical protein ACTHN5_14555 [Phycisphaerae bacterium]
MAMVKRMALAAVIAMAAGGSFSFGANATQTATGHGEVLPAKTPADYSTPKKAIASFLNAVQSTDEKAINAALVVSPEQQPTVDAYVKLILATNKLEKAAEQRFGGQAEQYFGVNSKQLESRLKAVEGAEAKRVGDSAIIEIPADEATKQPGGTVVVKRVDGEWKLDAGTLFKLSDTPKEQTERAVALAKKMVPLTEQMTSEIEAGKFASASEAYQAFWQRSLEAVKEGAGTAGAQPAK